MNHRIATHVLKADENPLNPCAGVEAFIPSRGRWPAIVDPFRFDKAFDKASDEGQPIGDRTMSKLQGVLKALL